MRVLYIIFLILTIVVGAPTLIYCLKLLVRSAKCSASATGTVKNYKWEEVNSFFQESLRATLPVYTFYHGGESYTSVLRFKHIKPVDREEDGRVFLKSSGAPTQKLFYCREGHSTDTDPVMKAFPFESTATVRFDPKDPENNYVFRRADRHPALCVFLVLTLVNLVLTVLFNHLSAA